MRKKMGIRYKLLFLVPFLSLVWGSATPSVSCFNNQRLLLTPSRRLLPPAEVLLLNAPPGAHWNDFAQQKSVLIMGYNVENLFTQEGLAPLKDIAKTRGVAQDILRERPTLAVLQEVGGNSVKQFCQDYLNDEYVPLVIRGNDPRGIEIAFLIRRGTPLNFRLESHRDEPYSDPIYPNINRVFSRDLPVLIATAPESHTPLFLLIGGHGRSKQSKTPQDPESDLFRTEQGNRTAEIIQSYRQRFPGVPVFMEADFNDNPNTADSYQALRDMGMVDAFDSAREGTTPPGSPERVTLTYHPPEGKVRWLQFDALLASPEGQTLILSARTLPQHDTEGNALELANTAEEQNRQNSDHRPILIGIDLTLMLQRAGLLPKSTYSP